jgi:hypothetical protein
MVSESWHLPDREGRVAADRANVRRSMGDQHDEFKSV